MGGFLLFLFLSLGQGMKGISWLGWAVEWGKTGHLKGGWGMGMG